MNHSPDSPRMREHFSMQSSRQLRHGVRLLSLRAVDLMGRPFTRCDARRSRICWKVGDLRRSRGKPLGVKDGSRLQVITLVQVVGIDRRCGVCQGQSAPVLWLSRESTATIIAVG